MIIGYRSSVNNGLFSSAVRADCLGQKIRDTTDIRETYHANITEVKANKYESKLSTNTIN